MSEEGDDQRDELISRALSGELSPPEAEQKAEQLGVGPLEASPSHEKYRPEDRPYWTLPMALEWICSGDYEKVRRVDDDVRRASTTWFASSIHRPEDPDNPKWSWSLIPQRTSTALTLARHRATRLGILSKLDDHETLVRDARTNLWAALQAGTLVAVGMKDQKRISIPAIEWLDLEPKGLAGETERLEHKWPSSGPRYTSVLLPRADLEDLWPPDRLLPPTKAGHLVHKPTPADKAAFAQVNSEYFQQRGYGLTKPETREWAKSRHVASSWALRQRGKLPEGLLLGRGERPSERRNGSQSS